MKKSTKPKIVLIPKGVARRGPFLAFPITVLAMISDLDNPKRIRR